MKIIRLFPLAAALAMPVTLAAQQIKAVGPPPDAEAELVSLASFHNLLFQSFMVPEYATHLLSFSFWWTGHTMPDEGYFVRGDVGRSATEVPRGLYSDSTKLDRRVAGWYTMSFYMPVVPREQLFFWFVAGDGGSDYPQIPSKLASVKITTTDTYADGEFENFRSETQFSGGVDMLFQAEFMTVTPEPLSIVLLGSGLAGLGGMARRRRRKGLQGSPRDTEA